MSTILLNQSSLAQVIECVPGARFVFAFPTDAAELSRSADDLVISFADGGSITLNGFYETYTQQEMPTFEVGGDEVSGAEFFAALDQPDLMPAAGPEPAKDTHYQEWSNMDLLGGIDRLGGLEIGWPDGGIDIHDDGGASGGDVNHPISITPADPVTPGVPIVDPNDPDAPLNSDPLFVVDDLRVHESALGDGNPDPVPGTHTASGAMLIDAPDGLRSIVIADMLGNEYTVYLDSTSNPDVPAGSILAEKVWVHGEGSEGYLHNFAYDGATGRFTYDFTLNDATPEHLVPGEEDAIGHLFKVTVDDKDSDLSAADSASSHILVTIVDDVPVVGTVTNTVENDSGVEGEYEADFMGSFSVNFGADGIADGKTEVPFVLKVQEDSTVHLRNFTPDNNGGYSVTTPDGGKLTLTHNGSGEVSYVYTPAATDIRIGLVPSGRVSPSSAASIIAIVPLA